MRKMITSLTSGTRVVTICNAPIWLIVWCVWVCDESHIGYLLGWTGLYYQLQRALIVTSPFEV